jgi:hypothetical protein
LYWGARAEFLAGLGSLVAAWPQLCAGYVADAIGREAKPWHRLDAGWRRPRHGGLGTNRSGKRL